MRIRAIWGEINIKCRVVLAATKSPHAVVSDKTIEILPVLAAPGSLVRVVQATGRMGTPLSFAKGASISGMSPNSK
jgi:hypothetical protein